MTEHDEPNYVCADPRDAREAVLRKNIADCFREHSELTKENATLRAENAALRAALNAIANTPRMLLFPDPNAHSREAYLNAVFRVWSTANQIARTALEKA